MNCLVLDAMGVIFQAADDVAELLAPFVTEQMGESDERIVQSVYLDASLGKISPDNFWSQVDVAPDLEDAYLSRHLLSPGVKELLNCANEKNIPVWCLSNDIGRWSEKLRDIFEIEELLAGSVISGDVGVRKPDSEIYKILVERSGYKINELLFVDDREKNVMAARDLGIETILFKPEVGFGEVKVQIL